MTDLTHTIDATTLRKWLNDGQSLALFDVREHGQYGEGHPFFAVPLPYSRLQLEVGQLAPRRAERIVLFDDGDAANEVASRAARQLAHLGYLNVTVLDGGAPAWAAAGYTLFKGVNVPSKTFGELVEQIQHTPRLSADDLAARRAAGERFLLVDGRTEEEHRKMTIPGAVSCPNGELALRLPALLRNPNMPVVVHCAGRTRSIVGAQTLLNLGLPNPVLALENGTQGWYLAGHALQHGSDHFAVEIASGPVLAAARERSARLLQRFGLPSLSTAQAQQWLDDTQHTTYLFDIRSAAEFARRTIHGAVHAPGGQLVQATDRYIGVRGSRVIVFDDDRVRAPVVATWLHQMGYETAVLADGVDAALQVQVRAWPKANGDALPVLDVDLLRALHIQAQALVVIDLRDSPAFERGHASGAVWSIRPRLLQQLRALDLAHADPVVLIANEPEVAILAGKDLLEAGYRHVYRTDNGYDTWQSAGLPEAIAPEPLPAQARIDYLFFVHDRHEGNRDAARAYLAWETGLIAQCAPDELGVFRIAAPWRDEAQPTAPAPAA
ncbi:rhodanese-like domain-containing protein [Cupriavidus sp. WKF15]|uniref:rhodanese-like domain-containing protein n=1 Tax=Cupriavidus sp. WKF15 TaxID=3032282 RepID=UPI0023E0E48D|nr:rhodanese-like domain-containing protein [Cupriavidus sp. WKF15]WER48351.1 rhodanese-like domain-containing protein [Cupriavidus sp. WKF15]